MSRKNAKSNSPAPSKSTTASAPAPAAPAAGRFGIAPLVVLHGATAAWIGYGAVMKAWEFNPNLLPGPILSLLQWVMKSTSVDPDLLMTWSLRSIIGAEIFIALAILFSTRYARLLAILTLSVFCAILTYAIVTTAMKDGVVKALTGGCGCFGEDGLPASVMFLVDALLLANALFLVPRARVGSLVPVLVPLAIGAIATFAVPEPEVKAPDPTTDATAATTPSTAPSTAPSTTPSTTPTTPAANGIGTPWPAPPAKYEKNYFPRWKDWIGKPFRDQKLALAIDGPMPADFEKGDWLIAFSRQDCSDCQSMFRAYFAEPRAERVMKVNVPDARGTMLGMPCNGCEERKLYHVRAGESHKGKSPEYVFRTPVIVRMKDGIVTGVCTDRANAEEFDSVFPKSSGGSAAAPTAPATTPPAAETTPTETKPTEAKTTGTWPGPPATLKSFYVADFGQAVGKPLAELPFALLMENKLPADFLKGRWIVVFFREDCDHCYELLATHFTGKLKYPTLTVAIPDADPNGILGNPCDECAKVSLVKGPNYVIATPVVLAINDGVVECVVENVDDMAALEACLKFNE